MSISAGVLRYYEGLAEGYDRRFSNPRLNYMRAVEETVLLNTLRPGIILDIGCGTGEQSLLLAEKGFEVVAVDISGEMIRKARKKIIEAKLRRAPSLVLASAEALPFREKSFDGLLSIFGVFSHIPEANIAFLETHRVLKSGGKAVLTVVNRWNLTWWIYALSRCKGSWLISSLRSKEYVVNGLWTYYFSKSDIKKMLAKVGFKVKIGSLLLLICPFNNREMSFYEKFFIRFEDAVRWRSPFSGLGYYLLVKLEK